MASNQSETERRIREILITQFGRVITNIFLDPRSNNSKVFVLDVTPMNPSEELTEPQTALPSGLPGTESLPPTAEKLVIRFTNPEACLNDQILIQNEAASMTLAREATAPLITPIVPKIYGWEPAAGDNPGWMLMEFMPGEALTLNDFKSLEKKTRQYVVRQMVGIVKLLQQYQLPSSVKGYGGLGFDTDGSIIVGPTPIHGATGACETYHQLYEQYLQTQLAFMDKCDVVRGWTDTKLRQRIDDFVAKGFKPLLERHSEKNPRPTLVHGDLDLHNLLFDKDTRRLTGLLDFSFSHVASAADEYFYSFEKIQGLLIPPGADDVLRNCLLHGFDTPAAKQQLVDEATREIAILRDKESTLAGVQRPIDFMPGIDNLSKLYWFIQNASPGLFFIPRAREKMGSAGLDAMREHIRDDLERTYLGPWGF